MNFEYRTIHLEYMMTKINKISAFVIGAILFTVSAAKAECDGFYIAARGGMAKYDIDGKKSSANDASNYVVDKKRFMASGALGYRYKHVRAELEYVWRRKNTETVIGMSKARFKSHSYMFVVYYDFFPYSWFTPFVNAGVGYTRHRLDFENKIINTKYSTKDNNFTWSLGAGISAKITNRLNLDAGYRYYDMGDISKNSRKTNVDDQEIYMGLRYIL